MGNKNSGLAYALSRDEKFAKIEGNIHNIVQDQKLKLVRKFFESHSVHMKAKLWLLNKIRTDIEATEEGKKEKYYKAFLRHNSFAKAKAYLGSKVEALLEDIFTLFKKQNDKEISEDSLSGIYNTISQCKEKSEYIHHNLEKVQSLEKLLSAYEAISKINNKVQDALDQQSNMPDTIYVDPIGEAESHED